MNIAMVCDPVTHQVGGSFISTLNFAQLLQRQGHHVILIAARSPDTEPIEYYGDVKIYRYKAALMPKTEGQFYLGFTSVKRLRQLFETENIQVLHPMIPTPLAVQAVRAARRMNLPIVAHSHTQPENLFLHLPGVLQWQLINDLFYKYMLWIYRQADIILCPSQFSEKLLLRYDASLNTRVVSNGVDLTKFKRIDPQPFIDRYQHNPNHKRLLFVGRLHPEKRVETLIDAMPIILQQAPDVYLDIVGRGHLDIHLQKRIDNLNLNNHARLYGKISDEELLEAYNACDIFVLPSLAELEGMVVLEAMACGKPILIADAEQSASTFFVKDNGFLFTPEDHQDLADKALTLLLDDDLRHQMAQASLAQSKTLDINHSVSLLEETYTQVVTATSNHESLQPAG